MRTEPTLARRFMIAGGLVLTLAFSLLLLGYTGWGEARRTYPRFEFDRLAAQGEIVSNSLETFLLAGLPLEQFPGFTTVTQSLLDSDPTVAEIAVTNPSGRTVFRNARPGGDAEAASGAAFRPVTLTKANGRYRVAEDDRRYQVSIELRDKFEPVGTLGLVMPKSVITDAIGRKAGGVVTVAVIDLVVFALFVLIATRCVPLPAGFSTRRWTGTRALELVYTVAFLTTATVVVLSLIGLYADGIRGKTRSLGASLSQRLNAPLELGLSLDDLDGIDSMLADYRRLNPDLSFVAVETDGRIVIDTNPAHVGQAWKPHGRQYEYEVALSDQRAPGNAAAPEGNTSVHLGIPKTVVYGQLFRSVKNFAVVFIGAGLLAMLSLSFVTSLVGDAHGEEDSATAEPAGLRLLRPFYFLTVFVEGLSVSFLPQYLRGLDAGGGHHGSVSLFFTVYFVFFVLALIPAGRFAERGGGKAVLWSGALVVALAAVLMAGVQSYTLMYGVRALAGMGQGMLSIGVQSYILRSARSNQRTRGAAIIVFGYNGGMISGAGIGALLVTYMDARSVFLIGAVVGAALVAYAARLVPPLETQAAAPSPRGGEAGAAHGQAGFMTTLASAVKDWNFVKTTLLIGIPAKAAVAGITVFALPLVLARRSYAQEDIGQIIMLYSAGVLICSSYVSRLVDRLGRTGVVLFVGAVGGGLAMTMIGLIGWGPVVDLRYGTTLCLVLGMSALGLAHGLINAPIMTHIANTPAADVAGSTAVTSVYRFVERIGHMGGPILVGQLLAARGQDPIVISMLGLVTVAFGLAFAVPSFSRGGRSQWREPRDRAAA